MRNADAAVQTLMRLHEIGLHIAIDDFGTGYSSLSYLKRFPIDRLKIDHSFVRDLEVDADDRAIATAVVTLGHSLEMRVIADVGLLGLPNAGKSTLIRAVSAARPKVADYPFTTMFPNLGVVSLGIGRSFVMADIPGLIEGAAEGAGLGIRFLKHLQRTRVLLHLVDILPPDPAADPVKDARSIVAELKKFSKELATRERWLVLNKVDLLPPAEAEALCKDIVRRLRWKGPLFKISAATGAGTRELCEALMRRIEEKAADEAAAGAETP